MGHPEYIYWTAVCVIAWPAALFSRCAGILALTWAIGQIAYVIGLPEPQTQVALYTSAGLLTWLNARYSWCRIIAALYAPLALLSGFDDGSTRIWWAIFAVAMAQVVIVPATVDWRQIGEVRVAFRERRRYDDIFFKLRSALCW